jgi:hypothetical protein
MNESRRLTANDRRPVVVQECRHSWVAGMLYVSDEDLDTVAASRTVECEKCEAVYGGAE